MEVSNDDKLHVVSGNEARAGETGHHVRYVLAFGLIGVVTAFVFVGIYLNFDAVSAYVAQAMARDPREVIREIGPYAVIFLFGALATLILFTVWNLILGPSHNASQRVMRLRVTLQFVIILAIAAVLYLMV